MASTTRKFFTAGAVVALALLGWWWWSGRGGEVTQGAAEAPEDARGGVEVAPLVDRARLQGIDLRRAERAGIAGHVREPDGRPVAGATVCAGSWAPGLPSSENDARNCATSEADGSYAIEGLLAVPQFVHASAPGHIPGPYRAGPGPRAKTLVRLQAGQVTRGIDVVLRPGGVELKGIVRDLSGGELEGALVWADYAYARSGADGGFTLWVEPGEVLLRARAEGYAPGYMFGVAPGLLFELALTPESVLVGKVVRAEDGRPLADAEVQAKAGFENFGPAITDASGQFRIEGLKPGSYRLEAFHDEAYGAGAESAVLGLGETSEPIEIRAYPAYLVEGTVTVAGGDSCESGWVRLTDAAAGERSVRLEADGLAHLRGVLPGTYEVQVQCSHHVPQSPYPPVTVTDAPVRGLRWEVLPGQSIRGKVVQAGGAGVAGLHVTADPLPDPAAPRAQTTRGWSQPTASDGSFEAVGLLPGRYHLSTYASQYPSPDPPLELELPAGQDLEGVRLELPATGELRGTVKDSEGKPVKGVEVVLRGDHEGAPSTRTLDDGSFHLPHVPAGSYRVLAMSELTPLQAPGTTDDDPQGVSVALAAGETREVQLVVKSQHGRIVGRVVDRAGGPLSDAFVEASRESDRAGAAAGDGLRDSRWNRSGAQTRMLTDQDGRFELTGLAEGVYTLVAQRRGGGEGSVEHVAIGSDVRIEIAEAGSIAGTVRIQGGGSPEQFSVTLNEPKTGWRASDQFFRTGGAFRFPEVPAGDYQVIVEAAEGSSSGRASVSEGGRGEVQIELLPLVTVRGRVVDAKSGAPVPAMQVRIRARGLGHMFTMSDNIDPNQVTDAEGRFTVEKVASGVAEAMVLPKDWTANNGYGWTSMMVQVPASGASTIELPPLKIAKQRGGEGDMPGDLGLTIVPPAPEAEPEDARLVVAMVRPGGPAMQAGVKVGDEIVSVDGQDVTGLNSYLFHTLSRVPAGTKVQLGLARGATVEVTAAALQ